MTAHDIMAMVDEVKQYGQVRINTAYDVDSKYICLKFRTSEKQNKFIMLDSGKKLFISSDKNIQQSKNNDINTKQSKTSLPTSFVMKLRKHLENKLLLDIVQANNDRVVDMYFGYGTTQYHLIAEVYASGNFIFTDENYKILALSHIHVYANENICIKVDEIYPLNKLTNNILTYSLLYDDFVKWYTEYDDVNKNTLSMKKIISQSPLNIFCKDYVEHILLINNIDPNAQIDLNTFDNIIAIITNNYKSCLNANGGYIVDNTYCPILYKQYENKQYEIFNTFSEAIIKYYSNATVSNIDNSKQTNAKKKSIDKEQQKINNINKQITKMQEKISLNEDKIGIANEYIPTFKMIIKIINEYVGFDFNDMLNKLNNTLEQNYDLQIAMKYDTTARQNIIHKHIEIKHCSTNYIYTCNCDSSPYDIITNLYAENKKINQKITSTMTLLSVPKHNTSIESNNSPPNIVPQIHTKRQKLWYEQFHWFFSSEGYLVILGKNAEQNEIIVKKYMNKNDIYLHSDASGSGSCIIKKYDGTNPIITIEEAGAFLICHTKAWNNSPDKFYWVCPDQVSKTTESGEHIGKGSFIIRGQKNYCVQPKLELGLTIMFKYKNNDVLQNKFTLDDLEFALPMCAPYRAINKLKFKIKIVPGTGKITKTIKGTIIGSFMKQCNEQEIPYLKNIEFDEFQNVMVNNIKCL